MSLRCSVSGAAYITRTAPLVLGLIGDADPLTRTGLLFTLGDAQDDLGEVLGAERSFSEAWKLGQLHGFKAMGAIALAHCALSVNYQGRRGAALALCKKGMEEYRDSRGTPLPIAGLLYVVAGELAYEENALERALRLLETGVGLGKLSTMPRVTLYGMNELTRTYYACGERKAAFKTLQEAHSLASKTGEEGWITSLMATEAALALREGSRDSVLSWVEHLDLPNNTPLDQTRKHEYTVMIRVFLKTGQITKAKALLPLLEEAAAAQGRKRHLISIFIQRALAEELLGQRDLALSYLDKALSLARKEGYLRAFLDEGEALANLLNKWPIKSDSFVSRLREAFVKKAVCESNYMPRDVEAQGEAPLEPLSDRELEVLRLLRTRLSTPQIAEKLYVSSSTVRSHIKHIYVKLDVHSRFEALQRAKELGLI